MTMYESPIVDPPNADRLESLRTERLARSQGSMRAHDVEACVLFNEPNIRYATGASAMPVYAMSTFVRCAVVPQEGQPILFEHPNSVHRSRHRAPASVRCTPGNSSTTPTPKRAHGRR
jgi:Xaa-Pro aminopeptidase